MKPQDLQTLIASGEGQLLEFKRSGVSHLGREICAFANSLGGRILLGVSDAGEIVQTTVSNQLRSEIQSIARNLEPPLMVNLEEVDGVLVINVPASRFKPHSAAGKFYLREGATCQQMNRDEIREFFYQEGLVYFDEKTNERFAWPDDLDQTAYDTLLKVCRITPTLDAKRLLNNLGLLKGEKMTYAGSLLLGTDCSRLIPGSSINCCLFQGTTSTRILDQKIYTGEFLGNYHAAVNYLLAHLNTAYEIAFERTEQLELPEAALREALLNAMGHRDYRKPGDLQVHLFQDRLEIVNPGGLVGGLTVDTLGTRSIPRNPLLFGMMQRMDLVEKVGSGFKRIREYCDKQNCPHPEIQADKDWFRMIFRRQNAVSAGASPLGNGLDKAHDEAHDQAHDEAPVEAPVGEQVGEQVTGQVAGQVAGQVTGQVSDLLQSLQGELSRKELMSELHLAGRDNFEKLYLQPALKMELIERTIPDKPNSRLQKYRLTPKGAALLKKVNLFCGGKA